MVVFAEYKLQADGPWIFGGLYVGDNAEEEAKQRCRHLWRHSWAVRTVVQERKTLFHMDREEAQKTAKK